MTRLSAEILKVNQLTLGLYSKNGNEASKPRAINFLICLDFLVKGVLSHWTIKLQGMPANSRSKSANGVLKGMDVKFPLLIGD